MPLTTPWRSRALTAALLAAVLTTSTACGNDAPGTSASGSIKIGLLASLSGTYQAVGTEIRDGFQLYLDTHDGKLGGRQVDLVIADEGNGAQTAVPAATKLLKQDRVSALTGIVGGGSVAGVTPCSTKRRCRSSVPTGDRNSRTSPGSGTPRTSPTSPGPRSPNTSATT